MLMLDPASILMLEVSRGLLLRFQTGNAGHFGQPARPRGKLRSASLEGTVKAKAIFIFSVCLLIGAALAILTGGLVRNAESGTSQARIVAAYGKLPLSFEANEGQADEQVKFLSRGSGYTLYLMPTEALLTLQKPSEPKTNDTTELVPVSTSRKVEDKDESSASCAADEAFGCQS